MTKDNYNLTVIWHSWHSFVELKWQIDLIRQISLSFHCAQEFESELTVCIEKANYLYFRYSLVAFPEANTVFKLHFRLFPQVVNSGSSVLALRDQKKPRNKHKCWIFVEILSNRYFQLIYQQQLPWNVLLHSSKEQSGQSGQNCPRIRRERLKLKIEVKVRQKVCLPIE